MSALTPADAADRVQAALAEAFPDTEFLVRLFAGDFEIDWDGGPTTTAVRCVTRKLSLGGRRVHLQLANRPTRTGARS